MVSGGPSCGFGRRPEHRPDAARASVVSPEPSALTSCPVPGSGGLRRARLADANGDQGTGIANRAGVPAGRRRSSRRMLIGCEGGVTPPNRGAPPSSNGDLERDVVAGRPET